MAHPIHYDYRDERRRLRFTVVRQRPKRFEVLDARKRLLAELPGATVLYRLPELVAVDPWQPVFVCEGERDCDHLRAEGLVATTNPGGCRHGWKDEYSLFLKNRRVIILAEQDRPGAKHAEAVLTALAGIADAAILKLPRLRRAEDVSD